MSTFTPFTLINGAESSEHSVLDRAFAFGDGVFETILFVGGKLAFERFHVERLQEGCRRLSIAIDVERINSDITVALNRLDAFSVERAVVKVTVTRGVGGRGYAVMDSVLPTLIIGVFPQASITASHAQQGVAMLLCEHRLSSNPVLAGIKHLNRLDNVLAKIECQQANKDDGIVCDQSGRVVEAVSSNVFVRFQAQWVTPLLETCGVLGVTRRVIMENLLDCKEAHITVEQLLAAGEVFVCNSVNGIWPVRKIADVDYKVGDTTLRLQSELQEMIEGDQT
jgi:4-amino-4-deoxychorismate lyase